MCFHIEGITNLLRIPFMGDMMVPHRVIEYPI